MGNARSGHAPTIHDVARRAGVAASTVSRALSKPDRVNAATRARILQIAEEMGFRPSPIARALPSGRTLTLGLLVPDITNPFFLDLIRGAERAAAGAGYSLVLADTDESPDGEATLLDRLVRAVDGLVIVSSRRTDDQLRDAFSTVPLVVVNRRTKPVPGVVIDAQDGAKQAARHLAELGHRRIGYLAGPRTSWSNARRWKALRDEGKRHGFELHRVETSSPTVEGGELAAEELLSKDISAIVTFNDLLAFGLLRRFRKLDVDVPGNVSVLGCDDIFGADFCHPPLTTLAAPIEDAGRAAVRLLLTQLQGELEHHEIVLPTRLVVRDSTAPVRDRRST